ncbi:OpgC domain-containing protein [Aureimonas sp. ME7]|uniref:OpgC family protein n=1 Tax=Aureimonas sp. ME7 TaxID=2744252 RepID=UPI0015F451A2|nr:OpgC domain-containing protein [Aureimonas sp. ME7]
MAASIRQPTPGRDHRVDFYRGLALLMIFVNHVPGVLWERFTSRNFGFSDSAEVFVFLAGFSCAFAYGRSFLQASPLIASIRALRRSGVLYLVHIALTMIVVSLYAFTALASGDGRYLMQLGIGYFMSRPVDTLAGIATLGHQLAYLNILPMYSVLLLMVPAMLAIVRRFGLPGLLLVSGALWALCGMWRFNLPNHPNPGGWQFNPFAWQFIFAIGLAAGLAKAGGRALVAYSRPLYVAASAYLALSLVFVAFSLWGWERALPLPDLLRDFDKTYATLPRLLHVLALVYVFAHAPAHSPLQRVGRFNPFTLLGRHSLPVFATGTVLSLAFQMARLNREPSLALDTALIALGIALHFALALFLDWWRAVNQPAPAAAAVPAPAGWKPAHARTGRAQA